MNRHLTSQEVTEILAEEARTIPWISEVHITSGEDLNSFWIAMHYRKLNIFTPAQVTKLHDSRDYPGAIIIRLPCKNAYSKIIFNDEQEVREFFREDFLPEFTHEYYKDIASHLCSFFDTEVEEKHVKGLSWTISRTKNDVREVGRIMTIRNASIAIRYEEPEGNRPPRFEFHYPHAIRVIEAKDLPDQLVQLKSLIKSIIDDNCK